MKILKPHRLLPGDLIGLVSPAGPVKKLSAIDKAVRYIEKQGYRVSVGRYAGERDGYMAGSDRQRLSDLHVMFRNRRVRAIVALRGGYGTSRLLGGVDYRLIRRNPKILVGFSDITALQLAIWSQARLVTFNGPMAAGDMQGSMDSATEHMFWSVLTEPDRDRELRLLRWNPRRLYRGISDGRLLGGNLSMIASLIGTPYMPDLRRALLFMEEVGEEPYRIDRMLTQLANAGALRRVNGLIAGRFTDCKAENPARSRTTDAVLGEFASLLRVPFLADLPFGHETRKLTIPVGVRARLNVRTGSIALLESPVR